MLTLITIPELTSLLMSERKYVDPVDAAKEAKKIATTMDSSLDVALSNYVKTGKYTEVDAGDMSLLTIKSLRRCGFLEAAMLLDAYIKDPETGLAFITRR